MKALFVTCHDIYDPYGNGGVKASRVNLKLMKECFGEELTVFSFRSPKDTIPPKGAKYVVQPKDGLGMLIANVLGGRRYYPWQLRNLRKIIDEQHIDLIFVDNSVLGKTLRLGKTCKKVVFFHNIEADYTGNKVREQGWWYLPAYWCTIQNEKVAAQADMVICLNKRDEARLMERYKRKADFLLPITFEDQFDESRVQQGDPKHLLFLGSDFEPNRLSIEWFMENVMTKMPDYRLDIVGKGFENHKKEYEGRYQNVNVIGSVEDPDEYYYSHPIVVMPILYGAGMKVKTAEAMMFGRTILASREALEGYDTEGVDGISCCTEPEDYILKLKEYEGQELPAYRQDVRRLFLQKYETKVLKGCFAKKIKELME